MSVTVPLKADQRQPLSNGKTADSTTSAPYIPHITDNLTSLNVVLRRQALYTFHELSIFLKSLESSTLSDNEKKRSFLELLVKFRQNFLRLYVISKWAQRSLSVQTLIDLFAWLRQQSQTISGALTQLGTMKQSMVSAKIPNPDISTALEVLVKGRPQLPAHGFLKEVKLTPRLILRTLKRLNVAISTRLALQENLPSTFYNYTVKDGRATFKVAGCFQCAISIADDNLKEQTDSADVPSSASFTSPFYLMDFKLGFRSKDTKLVPAITALPAGTFRHLERFADFQLAHHGLSGLYRLLHEYALSCKLYTLHRQLLQLRVGLWRSHMVHTYDAERCFIVITYWLKRKAPRSTIEIGKLGSDELGFRWIKEGRLYKSHGLKLSQEDGSIDIEGLVRKVIALHIELAVSAIQQGVFDTVESADKFCTLYGGSQLVLGVNHTRTVIYSIDPLSGDGYFQNPTPLMNAIARQINSDPRNTFLGLLRLRLETQKQELAGILKTTGWQHIPAVKLGAAALLVSEGINDSNGSTYNSTGTRTMSAHPIMAANLEFLKNKAVAPQLLSLEFYRRREWPREWFLAVAVPGYSTRPQFWVSKVRSSQGNWTVDWSCSIEPPAKGHSHYSYFSLIDLAKVSTSKLVCYLIVQELTDEGCQIKSLDKNDSEVNEFVEKIQGGKGTGEISSLLLLSNKSLFAIPNARDSLVLVALIDDQKLTIRIYGKLQSSLALDATSSNIASSVEGTSINLNRESGLFIVETVVNLTERFGSGDRKSASEGSPATSGAIENFSSTADSPLGEGNITSRGILSDSLSVLKQLSGLLSLLQLVGRDSELKLLDVSLDKVSFQYGSSGSESISLQVIPSTSHSSDAVFIEMPENNPHQLCLRHLINMVSSDFSYRKVGELITYLKLTLPLFKTYIDLTDDNKKIAKEFSDANDGPDISVDNVKLTPDHGYSLSLYHFELMKVLYYKTISKKVDKKQKFERFRYNLKVELRHRYNKLSLRGSVYLISLDDPYIRLGGAGSAVSANSIQLGTGASPTSSPATDEPIRTLQSKILNTLGQYFSGDRPIDGATSSVVCLKNAVACDYKSVAAVLQFLHKKMEEVIYQ
ncbi:hypothetical protein FOA43_001555 [Brettanomyces nanus]|uniref:Mediator of RNA polymerase II transcription subunit 14 n=1 Tax=Eeniella nana TaxID=13502 RepID=A0A875RNW4_EENNA|nr:uncharacterized protein FOA43_001555 [Brettanomyces nanus]QPG74230.1 hypothetical protein FOA43_001555 [Brettanomyces nanus]